jgi:hypothetical protein
MISKSIMCVTLEEHILKQANCDPDFACTVVTDQQFQLGNRLDSNEIDGVLSIEWLPKPKHCKIIDPYTPIILHRRDECVVVEQKSIVGFYK